MQTLAKRGKEKEAQSSVLARVTGELLVRETKNVEKMAGDQNTKFVQNEV